MFPVNCGVGEPCTEQEPHGEKSSTTKANLRLMLFMDLAAELDRLSSHYSS